MRDRERERRLGGIYKQETLILAMKEWSFCNLPHSKTLAFSMCSHLYRKSMLFFFFFLFSPRDYRANTVGREVRDVRTAFSENVAGGRGNAAVR